MGNAWRRLQPSVAVEEFEEEDVVKVVKVNDGEVFEYPGPVFVEDLMYGFQGYVVLNRSATVLPPDTQLDFNETYYLVPHF
ncbi:hypothetical protein GOP47_0005133 [Adiantum capillus-veneris]|uniref:Uncharacterized protein n=1 Tax=Adiantum capillus-veneris TaxID=13818 RepID=A0A9D4V4Z6_ADICA|nr:hypothetical protein GOP47_0005133 [Adiantum capillus-veneris]